MEKMLHLHEQVWGNAEKLGILHSIVVVAKAGRERTLASTVVVVHPQMTRREMARRELVVKTWYYS